MSSYLLSLFPSFAGIMFIVGTLIFFYSEELRTFGMGLGIASCVMLGSSLLLFFMNKEVEQKV